MHPAIFLDRDGVIIENRPDYVRSWRDVLFFPQALDALARIALSPYKIVIITNQSAIGRGLITPDTAGQINLGVLAEIRQTGGRIDGVYQCPHSPEDGCNCRKPRPGLILAAAADLDLDLERSVLIGDALTDLLAGQAAGIGQLILVRTGRGALQEPLCAGSPLESYSVYDTLSGALSALIP